MTVKLGWFSFIALAMALSVSAVLRRADATPVTPDGLVSIAVIAGDMQCQDSPNGPARCVKQLAAIASFANGKTEDVTALAKWHSSDARVMAVSRTGLASAVRSGDADLSATYGPVTRSVSVLLDLAGRDHKQQAKVRALPRRAAPQPSLADALGL